MSKKGVLPAARIRASSPEDREAVSGAGENFGGLDQLVEQVQVHRGQPEPGGRAQHCRCRVTLVTQAGAPLRGQPATIGGLWRLASAKPACLRTVG